MTQTTPATFAPTAALLALSGEAPGTVAAHQLAGGGEPRTLGAGVRLAASGPAAGPGPGGTVVLPLALAPRRHEQALDDAAVAAAVEAGPGGALAELLPPFAAVVGGADGVRAATDWLGFRHVYQASGPGWAGLSTSARALAACAARPEPIDRTAIAVQSLLGWQVGTRTPFTGVGVLPAGAVATLAGGEVAVAAPPAPEPRPRLGLDEAVASAAAMLRDHLGAFLDDHPDAVLQLTGGQDSRVLLGAIPPARRRGLEVMTLAVPGSPDVVIAAELARRYGMRHTVIDLGGLEELDAATAHELVAAAARRLDCSADPVAWASVAWAEAKTEQRPRLSGLGGEVTRGFYYFGPTRDVPVTRARVERLAQWRMFTNEAVAADALEPAFAEWARAAALDELVEAFSGYGPDWFTATDEFYLHQRMRRWAGVLASATAQQRLVVNPMLDDRFLALALSLAPGQRRSSQFLSRLSVELDAELSAIPMDGRPAPAVYARPSVGNSARLAAMTGRKIAGKVRQRVLKVRRPPAGGDVLAAKVTEYYRADPGALDGVRGLGVFRADWLDAVLSGEAGAGASTAAMLVTLQVALESVGG